MNFDGTKMSMLIIERAIGELYYYNVVTDVFLVRMHHDGFICAIPDLERILRSMTQEKVLLINKSKKHVDNENICMLECNPDNESVKVFHMNNL